MTWCHCLAKAGGDPLDANALLVLIAAVVAIGAAILAAGVGMTAARRRHRQREAITGLVIVWGLVSAATVVWAVNRDWAASAERERQIESGDVDPRDPVDGPPSLWPLWSGLAGGYLALAAWAAVGRGDAGRPQG